MKLAGYPGVLVLALFFSSAISAPNSQYDHNPYAPPYDSVAVTLDSLRAANGELIRQQITTNFYKKINGAMTIVESRVCLTRSWNSERIDCWIYHLIDGELVNDEYIPGAE